MATHSRILAWEIPWTEEPGGLQSMGSQRVGHNWASNTHTHTHTFLLHKKAMSLGRGGASPQALCRNPRQRARVWQKLTVSRSWAFTKSPCSRGKPCSTTTLGGGLKSLKCTAKNWSVTGLILHGSSVHGISQTLMLEWAANSYSRGASWCRYLAHISWCLWHWQADSLPLAPPGKPRFHTA